MYGSRLFTGPLGFVISHSRRNQPGKPNYHLILPTEPIRLDSGVQSCDNHASDLLFSGDLLYHSDPAYPGRSGMRRSQRIIRSGDHYLLDGLSDSPNPISHQLIPAL